MLKSSVQIVIVLVTFPISTCINTGRKETFTLFFFFKVGKNDGKTKSWQRK